MCQKILILFICVCSSQVAIGQKVLEAKVATVNGRPSIVINGEAINPLIYSLTDVPGGRWSFEEVPSYNMKSFCNIGFRLVQVDLFFDHVWMEDGSLDMTLTQKQLKGVLDVCPDAAIFLRFHVNAPKWWIKKFPDENTVYADTTSKPDYEWGIQRIIEDDEETPVRTSLASQKWKDEASEKLNEYLVKLASLPEGNAIAGVQIAGGVYGEWHYWGFIDNEPDISEPMKIYFQKWLKEKYTSESALRKAWKDPGVSFTSAQLPSLKQRRTTSAGIFRDPTLERKIIDYYQAQHQCVADDIIHFCRIVKESWPRPVITGAFYGYYYAVFGRAAAGGHLELQRVLASPHVDYISAPGTYYPDAVNTGDAYRSRSLITSVRLHNKLWLDEMDQQPPLVPLKDSAFATSLRKSIATVRRNIISPYVHGAGLWFYDFGPAGMNGGKRLMDHGTWGWWDEPTLNKDIGELKKILDDRFEKPFSRDADVLLVHDTKSFYYTGSDRSASYMGHWTNNWLPPSIYKSGVLHDVIHVDDLDLINADQYKAVVFMNTWTLNDVQKKTIRDKIARNGRHLIFLYAPGYCNEKTLDPKFISAVSGFSLVESKSGSPQVIEVADKQLSSSRISVWDRKVEPLFVVKDPKAIALGKLQGTNEIGFARKAMDTHTSWFFSLPPEDIDLWRNIFRTAGAHIYSGDGDVIYGGNGILSIHTAAGGPRSLTLKNGVKKSFQLEPLSTLVIDSNTGNILLR